MSKKIFATLIALVSSTAVCLADTCVTQSDIQYKNIMDLAATGKTTIGKITYELISEKMTGNNFNGKLLDTKKHLEGFVKISNASSPNDRSNTVRAVSLESKENQNFCAYNISIGTSSAVIALKSISAAPAAASEGKAPPPPPRSVYAAPNDAPPPPPRRPAPTRTMAAVPPASVSGAPVPPPPPPAPSVAPTAAKSGAPVPPPPPAPAVPTAGVAKEAKPQGRSDLLAQIQKGKQLKHVDKDETAATAANPSAKTADADAPAAAKPAPVGRPGQGGDIMAEMKAKQLARQAKQKKDD